MKLSNGVRYYRKKQKLTQRQVAAAVGVSRPMISLIEHGHIIPTMEQIEKLAELLQVTVGHLFTPQQLGAIETLNQEREE